MRDMGRMIAVLAAVCAVAALGLARVYDLTEEPIREAVRQELLRAIRTVLPAFENEPDQDAVEVGGVTYYPGTRDGEVVGVAFPVTSSEGYGGEIRALVGVDPEGRVTGVSVLSHLETPGLGAKFADPAYLEQFRWKTLEGAEWAVKKDGGDFDQITGATITPRALIQAMERGLRAYGEHRSRILERVARPGEDEG